MTRPDSKTKTLKKMIKDAEKFKEQDAQAHARAEARNSFEQFAYTLRNQLYDKQSTFNTKLSAAERKTVDSTVTSAISWIDSNKDATKEQIETEKKRVEDIISPITSKLYQGKEPKGPNTGTPGHEEL